jgi:hypothetical protein
MLERRKFRFSDRSQARLSSGQQQGALLTAEDAANLDAFAIKLQEAIDLLTEEVTAIGEGRLNVVSDIFSQKAALLKWLELKLPLIEPFMNHEGTKERGLPGLLAELKGIASEDGALLSRMSTAAGTIVREIEKATNRNNLHGTYGKSGEKIGKPVGQEIHLDREL